MRPHLPNERSAAAALDASAAAGGAALAKERPPHTHTHKKMVFILSFRGGDSHKRMFEQCFFDSTTRSQQVTNVIDLQLRSQIY